MKSRKSPDAALVYLHKPAIRSAAISADCHVCGRGVSEGYTVTARALAGVGVRLFCDKHCP